MEIVKVIIYYRSFKAFANECEVKYNSDAETNKASIAIHKISCASGDIIIVHLQLRVGYAANLMPSNGVKLHIE